jgi:cytochrome c peroxidase
MAEPLPNKVVIPADNPMTPAKIELGKQLYFDARLSRTGTVSCNSCHNVMGGGVDGTPTSAGIEGKLGGRNSPTVWNAAFLSVQFWDGRAKDLEEQAKGPLVNPIEMGMPDHEFVIASRVKKIPGYVSQFKAVFGGEQPVTINNLAKAIAAYERTLITPNAPYDRFLRGNKKALSPSAKRGMELVKTVGCQTCHSGPLFAGPPLPIGTGFYQKFPAFEDNEYVAKYDFKSDAGRYEATKSDADRHMWRVPTWRNIAVTAPYFHNGKVATLPEAVRVMAKTQLNKELKSDEVTDIVAFLESLTGEFPKQTMPRLPDTPGTTVL